MELQTDRQTQDSKQAKKIRRRRKIGKPFIALLLIFSIWGGVELYHWYNNPSIEGEWVSHETGKIVEFTKTGKVKVDREEAGDYLITAPDTMVYYIEDQEFNMHYELGQRILTWGIDGEEEQFKRKESWLGL